MVFDFHTHTFWSDGELSPMEQARRAVARGYQALGMTDHTGVGGVPELLAALRADREIIERHWPLKVIVGVELTHVPPDAIAEAAQFARHAGAEIVVVHGETPVEPVPEGTNRAAILSGLVDILAHPGHITEDEVGLTVAHDVYLEITSRRGHSLTNGHVARLGQRLGAKLIVNSDAHSPSDFLTDEFQRSVALGAGIDEASLNDVLVAWPNELLERVLSRRSE